jgi:hypothetical protein
MHQVQANIKAKLSEEVGAEMAAVFAKAFVQDVLSQRAKIEAARPASTARRDT